MIDAIQIDQKQSQTLKKHQKQSLFKKKIAANMKLYRFTFYIRK